MKPTEDEIELPPFPETIESDTEFAKHPTDILLNKRERQLLALTARVESLRKELVEMTLDRNLWRDAHNEDCPNLAQSGLSDSVREKLEAMLSPVSSILYSDLRGRLVDAIESVLSSTMGRR
jgi:hypothetical protein